MSRFPTIARPTIDDEVPTVALNWLQVLSEVRARLENDLDLADDERDALIRRNDWETRRASNAIGRRLAVVEFVPGLYWLFAEDYVLRLDGWKRVWRRSPAGEPLLGWTSEQLNRRLATLSGSYPGGVLRTIR